MSVEHPIPETETDKIARPLLEYLRSQTSSPYLEFLDPPERITGGFDAAIYGFRLTGERDDLAGPLVLRLYQPTRSAHVVLREAAVQTALVALGYPAPGVKFRETELGALGGPFMIMERLSGHPLAAEFELLRRQRPSVLSILLTVRRVVAETGAMWDAAQTRLQALDADRFLACLRNEGLRPDDFRFDISLASLRSIIAAAGVEGFGPALAWLETQGPDDATPSVVCHGDLQPLNVMGENGKLTGVLDWGGAVVGHPALDYGAALAILATAPIAAPWLVRPFIRMAMNHLARSHARDYFRRHPDGRKALSYFAAYNCLSQLAWVAGSWRSANGLAGTGAFDSAAGVRNLTAQFRRYTGVRLDVSLPACGVASSAT